MRFEIIFFQGGVVRGISMVQKFCQCRLTVRGRGDGGVQSVGKKSVSGHLNDLLDGWLSR